MCNTAVTLRRQIEHLIFKSISIQWPAMTENNRLSFAPILIINLRAIFGNNIRHFKKLLFQQKAHEYFSFCGFGLTTTAKLRKRITIGLTADGMLSITIRLKGRQNISLKSTSCVNTMCFECFGLPGFALHRDGY